MDPRLWLFMPGDSDGKRARADESGGGRHAGTVALHGRMLDIPHLKQARAVLARHEGFAGAIPGRSA